MESRKKNFVIAAVVAGVLSVAAGTVAAQDYFFPLFGAYVDHVVPDSPCGYSPVKSVTPTTFEDTIMLYYLCEDNRVIARRFFRMGEGSQMPKPVFLVPAPGSQPRRCQPEPGDLPDRFRWRDQRRLRASGPPARGVADSHRELPRVSPPLSPEAKAPDLD